jgi:hypothetical protein
VRIAVALPERRSREPWPRAADGWHDVIDPPRLALTFPARRGADGVYARSAGGGAYEPELVQASRGELFADDDETELPPHNTSRVRCPGRPGDATHKARPCGGILRVRAPV